MKFKKYLPIVDYSLIIALMVWACWTALPYLMGIKP